MEAECLVHYVRNLKPSISREVAKANPGTLQQAIMLAEQDELAFKRFSETTNANKQR